MNRRGGSGSILSCASPPPPAPAPRSTGRHCAQNVPNGRQPTIPGRDALEPQSSVMPLSGEAVTPSLHSESEETDNRNRIDDLPVAPVHAHWQNWVEQHSHLSYD